MNLINERYVANRLTELCRRAAICEVLLLKVDKPQEAESVRRAWQTIEQVLENMTPERTLHD